MSVDSYTALKTEIADYLDRDDLTSNIDTFIDLAEQDHAVRVRTRGMLKRSTVSVSTSVRYLALPLDYLAMRILRLMTTPVTVLDYINEYEMTRRVQTTTGKPRWYTIHEELEFDRVPDDTYTAEMIYYAKLTAISGANESNAILANYPSLYLYGALLAAEPFLNNDERIPMWREQYEQALMLANKSDRQSRHVGPIISRVAGVTP